MMETILTEVDGSGVATVTLNRPDVHNAFDGVMVAELDVVFRDFGRREDVRVIKLAAAGTSFSAGADLAWMRKLAEGSEAANRIDAERLARMLHGLAGLPKPTIALVQGPAYGGGVGLIAACDIAIATEGAKFALSEVRLGLVPAVIGPYVVAAVGQRWARRLFLTAERIDARMAERIGLVHEVVTADRLAARAEELTQPLREGAPKAQGEAKALVTQISGAMADDFLIDHTARLIARLRSGKEGREGIAAFLEKRKPRWRA